MKRILTVVALCIASMGMMAQTSLVATLTHEGTANEFYGANALVDAVSASADGDLITLSAGTFSGTTVNKSLTIRGNGTEPAEQATIINSQVVLEKSADEDEANHWLNIEGIKFDCDVKIQRPTNKTDLNILKDLCMKKCDIKNFSSTEYYPNHAYYGTLKNSSFINCRIFGGFGIFNVSEVSFINSIVFGFRFYTGTGGQTNNPKVNMLNTVAVFNDSPSSVSYVNAMNSIVVIKASTTKSYPFPSTFSSENTIITGYLVDETVADEMYSKYTPVNTQWMPMNEVFKTLTTYDALDMNDDYSLTDAAKAVLGTDGTEIGIYGGSAPFTQTVTYPRFAKFNVAAKAVDGKLAVDIATE